MRGRERLFLILNSALAGGGFLVSLLAYVITRAAISSVENSETWREWAWDAFCLTVDIIIPPVLLFSAFLTVAVLTTYVTKRKSNLEFTARLPLAVSVAASATLFLILPLCVEILENTVMDLRLAAYTFSISAILVMRSPFILSFALKLRSNVNVK